MAYAGVAITARCRVPLLDLLKFGFALKERESDVAWALQIEQIERYEDDALRFALELVLQDREVGRAVGRR
ncbi:hypothetical protein ACVIW0_001248 [Bradyrhizobium sp. USDA 4454]